MAVAINADPSARKVVLDDLAADASLVEKAQAAKAHPVLVARGHIAQAAVQLLLADALGDEAAAAESLDRCEKAFDVANSLASSGPRLELVGQIGGLAASGVAFMRASQRRAAARLLDDVAESLGEALGQQADDAHRGTVTLAAARALADGAKVVRGKARLAVLQRALAMATDARRDLFRAAELAKAALASATIASLEATLAKSAAT
jgi:hypothetical protein